MAKLKHLLELLFSIYSGRKHPLSLFIRELRQNFRKYQFDTALLTQDLAPLNMMSTQDAAARAQLDQLIEESMAIPSDLYLVFLPTID